MPRSDRVGFAVRAWDHALNLCIRSLPEGPELETLIAYEERPTLPNIRAALAIGRGRPWLPRLESALVEVGLAAIADIAEEADHEHRD